MNGRSVYGSFAVFVVLAIVAATAIVLSGRSRKGTEQAGGGTVSVQVIAHAGSDTVLNATVDTPPPGTALGALETAAKNHRVPLGTQEFDFGVMVASIGGYTAGLDGDWTYRVNDTMPPVGAADLKLNAGDRLVFSFDSVNADTLQHAPTDTAQAL